MMEHSHTPHLAYDELLKTLVDASDLTAEQQEHLKSCPRCERQAQDLQHRYRQMGRMAQKLAPEPSRPFRVPAHQAPKRLWYFKPGVAAGILGVLVFAFTVWAPNPSDQMGQPIPLAAFNAEAEAQLMSEVDDLVNDALPRAYQELAVLSEPILSEDLIDWIVPSIEEGDEGVEPRA